MDIIDNYNSSNPTGRLIVNGIGIKKNKTQNKIMTSQQASAERNEKINKNEYVCDNIETGKEDFQNCPSRYNVNVIFLYIFGLILLLVILYFIFKLFYKD